MIYKIYEWWAHESRKMLTVEIKTSSYVFLTLTGSIIAMGDHTHILIFSLLALLSDCKLLSCESRLIFLFYHLWQHSPIINYTAVGLHSHCKNMPSESTFILDKFTLYYFITSWFIAFLPTLRQAFFDLLTLVQRPASHWINWTPETSLGEPYFDRGDQTQRETVSWIYHMFRMGPTPRLDIIFGVKLKIDKNGTFLACVFH